MRAIETNEKNKVIWIHYDSDSLSDITGMTLVEEIPKPKDGTEQVSELYYTSERGFWYEYTPVVPETGIRPNETPAYEVLVNMYIRERYSVSDELAILRQKDIKPEEFRVYYDYAESCKIRAKE